MRGLNRHRLAHQPMTHQPACKRLWYWFAAWAAVRIRIAVVSWVEHSDTQHLLQAGVAFFDMW